MNLHFNHPPGRARLRRALFAGAASASTASICCATAAPGKLAPLASLRSQCGSTESRPARREERGSATILVLALLALMTVFLTVNQLVLHNLKRELRLVEQKQLKKFQPPTAGPVAPPAKP